MHFAGQVGRRKRAVVCVPSTLCSRYVLIARFPGKIMMIDIFVDTLNADRTFAGVFEADDTVSYFYLCSLTEGPNGRIIGAVQVYRGLPNFAESEVVVRWFDNETKVGVFIKGELGAYLDLVSGWGYPGTYSRHQPPP